MHFGCLYEVIVTMIYQRETTSETVERTNVKKTYRKSD